MFKEKFIRLCNEKNESPSSVCYKVGITPATFSKWTDESIPRKATLMRIADYFNITVDDLLAEDEKKPVHVNEPIETNLLPEEKQILSCYKKMSDADRNVLWALLDKYQTVTEDTFIDSNVNYGINNGISKVYEMPIKLQRQKDKLIDNVQYYEYAIGINTRFNGQEVHLLSFCRIKDENKNLALIANSIFGEADAVPLQIIKTVNSVTINKKSYSNISYTLQIKSVDNNGIELICPFIPKDEGNRFMFQNIIEYLKSTGTLD